MSGASRYHISPGGSLQGRVRVPGDKSISHRAVMLGAIAEGRSRISGFLEGEDALATLQAFRSMGASIDGPQAGRVEIAGVGFYGLQAPVEPLDLGNSGTALRLLAGLLAGQRFDTVLGGDRSLNRRPMGRISKPLIEMGADIRTAEAGTPPVHIHGAAGCLKAIRYEMPVASAQVKSCLLLAGLYADGTTCVVEPAATRDHTERMLQVFGYQVAQGAGTVCVTGGGRLRAADFSIPGDFSSAAFFLVGACIAEGSDLVIENVGVNPTRTGALQILRMMGADITLTNERDLGAEPVADLRVRHRPLHGVSIPAELVPLAIDEFPGLLIAAACAEGRTVLVGAEELRVKESDRIDAMARGLRTLGVEAKPTPDGMVVSGGEISGGTIESRGDHRIAMAFAIAGLRAHSPVRVADCGNVATSFPGFGQTARNVGLKIDEADG